MSFEDIFEKNLAKIGTIRYVETYKERPHISKQKIDDFENVVYISIETTQVLEYLDILSKRYAAATDIKEDFLIAIYDVNLRKMFVQRFNITKNIIAKLEDLEHYLKKDRNNNLEVRVFGLQNNINLKNLKKILDIIIKYNIPISEIDLFGNETRHIAIDLKIGASFNILMENRLYHPGELINNIIQINKEENIRQNTNKKMNTY